MFKGSPDDPLAAQKEHASKGNCERIEGGKCVGQAIDEDFARVSYKGPAGKAGGGGRKDKYP